MDTTVSSLFLVALVSFFAAVSPGPDFLVVVRNSLVYSRKIGCYTATGVSLGLFVHLAYTLLGIGILIAESPLIYNLIKYAGILYLFYLGISGIISSFKDNSTFEVNYSKDTQEIAPRVALKQGFLTNILNPKAALFFVSLFSQFITVQTPVYLRVEYAFVNWAVTWGWFLFLSYLITAKVFVSKVNKFRSWVDRIMGSMLMLLGLKMLFV